MRHPVLEVDVLRTDHMGHTQSHPKANQVQDENSTRGKSTERDTMLRAASVNHDFSRL